ncbi:MAG: hypothetical protein AAF940_06275, partial [Pseudomonadota bacterium]
GRQAVETSDVITTAPMALAHRLRRDPLDDAGSAVRVDRAIATLFPDEAVDPAQAPDQSGSALTKTFGHA